MKYVYRSSNTITEMGKLIFRFSHLLTVVIMTKWANTSKQSCMEIKCRTRQQNLILNVDNNSFFSFSFRQNCQFPGNLDLPKAEPPSLSVILIDIILIWANLWKRSRLFSVLFNTTNIKERPAVSGWIQEMLKKYFPNSVWMGVCVKYPPNMYIGAASSQPMKARLCKKREVTYLLHKRYKLTWFRTSSQLYEGSSV